jgi:P-type Cu+ transporter
MKNQKRRRNKVKEYDEIKLNDELSTGGLSCDCCNDPEIVKQGQQNDTDDHEDIETKKILSDKTFIIIGLVLTAAIVALELMFHQSFTNGIIMFILATPVQFLLGKPFYIRFYRALKNRKKFTTDTLVVLSTSVAYFYSLIILVSSTGTHTFFEASSSVLTIFTIGEYIDFVVKRL